MEPATLFTTFFNALFSHDIKGTGSSQLATGLTNGLLTYIHSINVVTIDKGPAGVGVGGVVGVAILDQTFSLALHASLVSHNIAGSYEPMLADALGQALSAAFATVIVVSAHPSVANGSGTIQLIANPAVSVPTFIQAFIGAGLTGSMSANLATAIAEAIDTCLPSAIGEVVIVGASTSAPAVGAGTGTLS